jgi:hypothetical protein
MQPVAMPAAALSSPPVPLLISQLFACNIKNWEIERWTGGEATTPLYYNNNHYCQSLYIAVVECMGRTVAGRASTNCISTNNPIALRTCTVEAVNSQLSDSVVIPCTFTTSHNNIHNCRIMLCY